MPLGQFDERILWVSFGQIAAGATAGVQVHVTDDQVNDGRVDVLMLYNWDTIVHYVYVFQVTGVTSKLVGTVSCPAATVSGFLPSVVDFIAATRPSTQAFIQIPSGSHLEFTTGEDTLSNEIDAVSSGGLF